LGVLVLSLITFISADDSKRIKYSKSTQLILNTSSTGSNTNEDLDNFPVFIKLDNTNFDFDVIENTLAGDISFSISDGSFLSYKIKKWDKANKVAEILIVVPKVLGNNKSQYIKMSWGASTDHITDQKFLAKIEEIMSHEAAVAKSPISGSSIFESSYGVYGVWSSNSTNGFSIITNEKEM
jgi:hypothetical protein